jgi:hypothetical protein
MSQSSKFTDLKASMSKALVKNEQAFEPVIRMLDAAVTQNWLGDGAAFPDADAIRMCLNDTQKLDNSVDIANCWAVEFANSLLVMQEVNVALTEYSVAEEMWQRYSKLMAEKFGMGVDDWKTMGALELYDRVRNGRYFKLGQFEAMKLISVMIPFEALHFLMGSASTEENVFGGLPSSMAQPRWISTYEDLQSAHEGKSNWEQLQMNIVEGFIFDIARGWGNDFASNALVEFLKQHGREVKVDIDSTGIASIPFPPQWVGLYTLWNHLWVMSQNAPPMASAILYFPRLLEDLDSWIAVRINALWLFMHELELTKRGRKYILPDDIGKDIARMTTDYASLLNTSLQVQGLYEKPPKSQLPTLMKTLLNSFFTTFGDKRALRSSA